MSANTIARPSLILAEHENAHREHLHQHQLFHHRRQASDAVSLVTEVVTTISVLQQIDVDSNGNIFSTEIVLGATGGGSVAALTAAGDSSTATTTAASPAGTDVVSAENTGLGSSSSSLLSQLSNSSTGAAAATTSTLSIPSTFASLAPNSNSTTLISSSSTSSSAQTNYLNTTRTSTTYESGSSFVYPTSSDGVVSIEQAATSSTSYSYETSSWSSTETTSASPSSSPSATGGVIVGGGSATGSAATTTATSSNDNNSSSNVSTPAVVGGVVGGVAGVAILVFLLMILIRYKKRHSSMLQLGSGEGPAGGVSSRDLPPSQPSGDMTQRKSLAFAVPAALASLTGYNRRASQKTERTISSTAGSERGFYRVSGRKLPSVLQSGGDGYGGGIDEAGNTWSGASFYRDSQGFYGGAGRGVPPVPTSPTSGGISPTSVGMSFPRDSGVPVMRPSPARTPVTEQGHFASPFGPGGLPRRPSDRSPTEAGPSSRGGPSRPPRPHTEENPFADGQNPFADQLPLPMPRRPDMVGRSHPSQDGSHISHASRFTEEV